MSKKVKYHLQLASGTTTKIYTLIIKDLQNQLKDLKNKKEKLDYKDYRYKYVRLHNTLKYYQNKIKKEN